MFKIPMQNDHQDYYLTQTLHMYSAVQVGCQEELRGEFVFLLQFSRGNLQLVERWLKLTYEIPVIDLVNQEFILLL